MKMIFKMKSRPKCFEEAHQLYLLIEKDANGTFFGVYDSVDQAKRCDGALGTVCIPEKAVKKATKEYLEPDFMGTGKNIERRQVIETYA
jgi:hypothetical protein